jgi:hypothetical protein
MLPEDKGTLVDADVEVDLDHSEEYSKPVESTSVSSSNNTIASNSESVATVAKTAPETVSTVFFNDAVNTLEYPEPDDGPDCILFKFKLPSNSVLVRRFSKTDTIDYLFEVLSKLINVEKGSFQLSAQYPKRTIVNDGNMATIASSGFQNRQEMLHVIVL